VAASVTAAKQLPKSGPTNKLGVAASVTAAEQNPIPRLLVSTGEGSSDSEEKQKGVLVFGGVRWCMVECRCGACLVENDDGSLQDEVVESALSLPMLPQAASKRNHLSPTLPNPNHHPQQTCILG